MGTNHSLSCNQITQAIWNWCISNKIWISAADILGRENVLADHESRRVNLDAEWKLDSSLLQTALSELECSPTIDLFASRLNAQLPRYVSSGQTPLPWELMHFHCVGKTKHFTPFPLSALLRRCFRRCNRTKAQGFWWYQIGPLKSGIQ